MATSPNACYESASTYQDVQPEFTQQPGAGWKKWEVRLELRALLDQNLLCYDGQTGDVPSQSHGCLSTQFKELRIEAVRVGFEHCYQQRDYSTILVVAQVLPESVMNEDGQLQMLHDTAVTRTGGQE